MKDKQLLIGFAAETTNVEEYATEKLREKNANMIVCKRCKGARSWIWYRYEHCNNV